MLRLLLPLFVSLADTAAAQLPFEIGFGADTRFAMVSARVLDFPTPEHNRVDLESEAALQYGFYLASFSYEGLRWRASAYILGAGSSIENARASLEVERVYAN